MPSTRKAPQALPNNVRMALDLAVLRMGSQAKVAADLGVSAAVINTLLKDRYPGSVKNMAERIRGKYMSTTVQCPLMGTLGRHHCVNYQARPLAFTNPQRSALHRACKTCKNRLDMAGDTIAQFSEQL